MRFSWKSSEILNQFLSRYIEPHNNTPCKTHHRFSENAYLDAGVFFVSLLKLDVKTKEIQIYFVEFRIQILMTIIMILLKNEFSQNLVT